MGDTGAVSKSADAEGLRARKKLKTRLAIRTAAFSLFADNGYDATTVEQIAVAADISPRTFYRYYTGKEAVLLNDGQIEPIVDAFAAAPADLPVVAAYRHAVAEVFGAMSEQDRADFETGQRLTFQIPEARGLLYGEYVRLIDLIAEALTHRPDAPDDAPGRRVLAGAIVGVLISAAHNTVMPDESLTAALTLLEQRLAG